MVVTSMTWLPCVVFGKGSTISIATQKSDPDAGKIFGFVNGYTWGGFFRSVGMLLR